MKLRLPNPSRRPRGFTLFESIVAMFILLMGVVGIAAVFSSGMHVRMKAQELVMSQELANLWAEWIRFRMNPEVKVDGPAAMANLGALAITDLTVGLDGDFYTGQGDLVGDFPANDPRNLPTIGRDVYRGYHFTIAAVDATYTPQWRDEAAGVLHPWTERSDGAAIWATADNGPYPGQSAVTGDGMAEVELQITRGTRRYRFNYVIAGIGHWYGSLPLP